MDPPEDAHVLHTLICLQIFIDGVGVGGLDVNGAGVGGLNVDGVGVGGLDVDGAGIGGLDVDGVGVGGLDINGVSVDGFRGEGGNGSFVKLVIIITMNIDVPVVLVLPHLTHNFLNGKQLASNAEID